MFGCDDSDSKERAVGRETVEDGETALLQSTSLGTAPSRELSESDSAMELSSIDASPATKIFQWLD